MQGGSDAEMSARLRWHYAGARAMRNITLGLQINLRM
jgi:hypothetical protein